MVAEARPVDPVLPPAVGEAGGVPTGAAAPRVGAAGQGPGPQPRQRAQRHPQGPHGTRSAHLRGERWASRRAPAREQPGLALPRAGPRPSRRPSPALAARPSWAGRGGRLTPGRPRSTLRAPAPYPRRPRQEAAEEQVLWDPSGPARCRAPSSPVRAATTSPGSQLCFLTSADTLARGAL